MPKCACDCHMHVFGDPARYPPAPVRAYTPLPARFAEYRAMASALGLARVVLVQPSAYGTDNRCMIDTLGGGDPAVRAVAVIGEETPEADLDRWHALGVRGVRLNLATTAAPTVAQAWALLRATATRVARLGWHVQVFARPDLLVPPLLPDIPALDAPVVIDHMGGADAAQGTDQPVIAGLISLLQRDAVWVKVSGATRVVADAALFPAGLALMRALIAANKARIVWGTDWPHIGPHRPGEPPGPAVYLPIDNGALLRLLTTACDGDAALLRRILADNPVTLYGFAPA
jgi:predicted TIM-barrel fold metal-dependent hydrolase